MKFRKLRIACSVFFGIICLMLVMMWVRSYWRWDRIHYPHGYISSWLGLTSFSQGEHTSAAWHFDSNPTVYTPPDVKTVLGFKYRTATDLKIASGFKIYVPYWFLVSLPTVVAAAPWLRWRYSLRALLAVITLVAVGLGAIVYFARWARA